MIPASTIIIYHILILCKGIILFDICMTVVLCIYRTTVREQLQ